MYILWILKLEANLPIYVTELSNADLASYLSKNHGLAKWTGIKDFEIRMKLILKLQYNSGVSFQLRWYNRCTLFAKLLGKLWMSAADRLFVLCELLKLNVYFFWI